MRCETNCLYTIAQKNIPYSLAKTTLHGIKIVINWFRELLNHLQIVVHSASSLFELVVNNAQSSVVFNEQIKSVVLIHSQLVSFNGLTINFFVDGFNVTSVGFHVVFAVFSLQINFFEGEGFC